MMIIIIRFGIEQEMKAPDGEFFSALLLFFNIYMFYPIPSSTQHCEELINWDLRKMT